MACGLRVWHACSKGSYFVIFYVNRFFCNTWSSVTYHATELWLYFYMLQNTVSTIDKLAGHCRKSTKLAVRRSWLNIACKNEGFTVVNGILRSFPTLKAYDLYLFMICLVPLSTYFLKFKHTNSCMLFQVSLSPHKTVPWRWIFWEPAPLAFVWSVSFLRDYQRNEARTCWIVPGGSQKVLLYETLRFWDNL